jgi:hypothetical protein
MMQKWDDLAKGAHRQRSPSLQDRGQPLERAGKLVKGKRKTVTDGPFAEAKDAVGGYTLIEARDMDQAGALNGLSHLRG